MHKRLLPRSIGVLVVAAALVAVAPAVAGATTNTGSAGPQRTGGTIGAVYTGPADLAAVASNVHFRSKSVTTYVSVPAGVAAGAARITISVGYGEAGSGGVNRITQYYDPWNGNGFLFDYPEGDGQAHQQDVTVTLTEPNPAGGLYNIDVHWTPTIEPLYDVSYWDASFTLLSDCSTLFGNPYLRLDWRNEHNDYQWVSLGQLSPNARVDLPTFATTLREIPHSLSLFQRSSFALHDWSADFVAPAPNTANLVPGTSQLESRTLWDSDNGCWGRVDYAQTITLDHYFASYFPGL